MSIENRVMEEMAGSCETVSDMIEMAEMEKICGAGGSGTLIEQLKNANVQQVWVREYVEDVEAY